jgi:hypothetical protein
VNADALEIILNNSTPDIARDVRRRVHTALASGGHLPGQPNHQEQPGINACTATGEVVRKMVLWYADQEYNGIDSGAGLTSMIWTTTLDHIDWAEVGRYYYVTAEA